MSTPYAMQTLETVTVAGIIGDLYGNIPHLREVCAAMRDRGISVILSVGDLGLVDSRPSHSNLGWASETLAEYQQTLLFVDGNCDRHNDIYGYPVDTGGYRWTASNIAHLPRGFRTTLGTGLSFAALGGANSVDRPRPLESVTADDLAALGHTRTDFLLGHDAPTPLPVLDRVLAAPNHWSADALEYAARGRRMFTRGFEQVRPRLYVGGHFHMHVDEHVDFSDFTTHVVLLPAAGATFSQATVDLRTLEVTPFELAF